MENTRRAVAAAAAFSLVSVLSLVTQGPAGADPAQDPNAATNLSGKTVFLDPGHNGTESPRLTEQVTDGRGGQKDCQTTGTQAADGYTEHEFNWAVAQLMKSQLEASGASVLLSRADDTDDFTCIDERANAENESKADAVVSIHADGSTEDGKGFHVSYSDPPLNDTQRGPSQQFSGAMVEALKAAGLTPSTYMGTGGLYPRSDLTGLNLSQRPSILVETANMRNADEAAAMKPPEGQLKYATAITAGIVAFLQPSPSNPAPNGSTPADATTTPPPAEVDPTAIPTTIVPEVESSSAPQTTSAAATPAPSASESSAAPTPTTPRPDAPPVTVGAGSYPTRGAAPGAGPSSTVPQSGTPTTAKSSAIPTTSAAPTSSPSTSSSAPVTSTPQQADSSQSPATSEPSEESAPSESTASAEPDATNAVSAEDASSQWGPRTAVTTTALSVYSDVNTSSTVLSNVDTDVEVTPVEGFKALVFVHGEQVNGRTTWVYGVFNGVTGWVPMTGLSST